MSGRNSEQIQGSPSKFYFKDLIQALAVQCLQTFFKIIFCSCFIVVYGGIGYSLSLELELKNYILN